MSTRGLIAAALIVAAGACSGGSGVDGVSVVATATTMGGTDADVVDEPARTSTTSTTSPPTTTSTVFPTKTNTGPTVDSPANVGAVVVETGETRTLDNVVAESIFVHGGGQLTATNIRVIGSFVVVPQQGLAMTKLHLTDSAVHSGMTINAIDSAGALSWDVEIPVDVVVSGTWLHRAQGDGSAHTEALAAFGRPQGARFLDSSFIQAGPFNGTATGAVNWNGTDTVFDRCYFGWDSGVAAYYTIYVEGRNNVVRNSHIEPGLGDYIYPESSAPATYRNNVDAATGVLVVAPQAVSRRP